MPTLCSIYRCSGAELRGGCGARREQMQFSTPPTPRYDVLVRVKAQFSYLRAPCERVWKVENVCKSYSMRCQLESWHDEGSKFSNRVYAN